MKNKCIGLLGFLIAILVVSFANASVILSPDSVFLNTAGNHSADYSINDTIDQSGLVSTFTNGLTDFDVYFATSPVHSSEEVAGEWISPTGISSGTVIYDLGEVYEIDRLALWNEEQWGIASFELYTDTVSNFATVISHGTFTPTDNFFSSNHTNDNYSADIFSLTSIDAQYVKLVMTGVGSTRISMGEIAFSVNGAPVPEPATMLLFGIGLLGLAGINRRKK